METFEPPAAIPSEQELDLWRLASESAVVGLCLVSPEGRFLEANPALCHLLGRELGDLRQLTWQALTHPDDLASDLALVEEVKANRRQNYRLRKRFLRADGSVIWVDVNRGCQRRSDGSVRLFVSQIVDVSEAVATQACLARRDQQVRLLAQRLELASETVGLGLYEADLSNGTAFYSAGFLSNLGYLPGEWSEHQDEWFTRLHPEDRATLEEDYRAVQDGSLRSREYRLRHKDGSYRWFLGHGRGIDLNADGLAQRIVGTCLDITDRKQADAELQATSRRLEQERTELRATLDGLLEPHILLAPIRDSAGTIVDFRFHDANPAACTYNRRNRQQLIGTSLLELLPAHQVSGLFALYRQTMESGEPLVLDDIAYANDFLGEERRYDVRGVRVGELLSYSWRDVTDRHRSAQLLKASERRYRLLAENVSDLIVHMRDGRIAWVSPSLTPVLGWQSEDWIGHPAIDFLEPCHRGVFEDHRETIAQGRPITARHRLLARDGRWHWMDTRATPFLNDRGETDGLLAVSRLVDTEVEAQQALERKGAELASKLRTSLTASVVAHEINQPLSVILLQAKLALQAARQVGAAADPLQTPLATLIGETERVVSTIERMRMLLRNVQTPQETVDLTVVLDNALLYLTPQLKRQGVLLQRCGTSGPILITGDAAQLQLAISNLIRNSLEALAENPNPRSGAACIAVGLERRSEAIVLRVADSGPGFHALNLSDLPLQSTKRKGMGLGLYVVQTTTENHGGTMTIGRASLGGAEVSLHFPLCRTTAEE